MCKSSIWTEIEDSDNEEDPAKGVDEETAVEEDKENLKGEIEGVKEKEKELKVDERENEEVKAEGKELEKAEEGEEEEGEKEEEEGDGEEDDGEAGDLSTCRTASTVCVVSFPLLTVLLLKLLPRFYMYNFLCSKFVQLKFQFIFRSVQLIKWLY